MIILKRFISFLLAVCALIGVGALSGCTYTPTEAEKAEVLEAFRTLYPMSIELNEYIFGAGLPTDEVGSDGDKAPLYKSVSSDARYKTESELKAAVLAVYSQEYYDDSLEQLLFTGYENNDKISPRYKEVNGLLQLDVLGEPSFGDLTGRFDVSTAKIEKMTEAFCQIKCSYVRGELSGEFTVTLAKTANGWRFDAPTV